MGQYYEDAGGYGPFQTPHHISMASLKAFIYSNIVDMVVRDTDANEGNANSLVGYTVEDDGHEYVTIAIDKNCDLHIEIVPEGLIENHNAEYSVEH